ncbi:hypothetical protein AGABI1DRAFT_56672 [Agaricus bisporus var. burnettii JB137-S8]|uniref:Uncharacterized protein n=1 Tax=Agaricus bisporus var. burnettii (strain JB137-S8 / ATCC MYA-4627 / FGSC 10392) TaxID=597362 RepID=K5X0C1_AGABU|nr:uncharacterized protein AGABI1DRAFT_56672 [Agaricus bisporus var. burnettii JB137-S8]EKM81236.1 hypothetical protein AGABI1DRAFT_56672 [Agaricus bisporus var. burnettii JB137-S8]
MGLSYPSCGTLDGGLWIKNVPSKYSADQVAQYLSTIDYEPHYNAEAISSGQFPINIYSLSRVMRLHMLAFPFENISMHYSADHQMDVSHEGIYDRFVKERKGSYCFGQNGLMLEMLRGLGFRAYTAAARVNSAPAGSPYCYHALTHIVILVQPFSDSNETYVVDVGFGSSCITRPLLLSNHPDNVIFGLSETERHRLTRSPRPDSSLSDSQDLESTAGEQWNLEIWHKKHESTDGTWRLQFSFTEDEFSQTDIIFGSFGICNRPDPTTPFWNSILCLKLFTIDNEETLQLEKCERPMYRIILFGKEVWKSSGANKEILRNLETELDRIRAIRDYFGIDMKDEDAVHIVGRAAAYIASN